MLVLLLLTLWTEDGAKIIAKELPTLEICRTYADQVAQTAREKGSDVSTNCLVIRRPNAV